MTKNTRHDWQYQEVKALYQQPFNDLLYQAQTIHRRNFDANAVQISQLLSIKTGACPEDCKYCSQSGHYNTGLTKEKLMVVDKVIKEAQLAKANGATRFCMGAAWRSMPKKDHATIIEMIKSVKAMGMETCMTLGMLSRQQAQDLANAGLDYYNHNLDTSPQYYGQVITTRTYQDRLDTLSNVREAGMKVCCGGIVGMGEQNHDRLSLLLTLANLPEHPESVPINMLIAIKGTPLENVESLDPFEFIRMVALSRIMMPKSYVRLSAGRDQMNDQTQALCFMAGANSIFYGERLLTASNPEENKDMDLFRRLGVQPEKLNINNEPQVPDIQQPKTSLYYDATMTH